MDDEYIYLDESVIRSTVYDASGRVRIVRADNTGQRAESIRLSRDEAIAVRTLLSTYIEATAAEVTA